MVKFKLRRTNQVLFGIFSLMTLFSCNDSDSNTFYTSDSFTGTTGTDLSATDALYGGSSVNWSVLAGDIEIKDNQAGAQSVPTGNASAVAAVDPGTNSCNYQLTFTTLPVPGTDPGILGMSIRSSATTTGADSVVFMYSLADISGCGAGSYFISEFNSSTFTNTQCITGVTPTSGDAISLNYNDQKIDVSINESLVNTYTTNFNTASTAVSFYTTNTGARVDNLIINDCN